MKLKINGFENEIVFDGESVNVLEVKDSKCYSHIISILNDKINGLESNEIFLLEDDEELKIDKEMYMIFDLFNIDYNSKKILNKLYSIVADNIEKSQSLELQNLIIKLRKNIVEEINELPFEFTMKSDLDFTEILKLYNLKIDECEYESVLEKVELLINLLSTLKIASILVIPNLKLFISSEELLELYKYSLYNNIELLLIERNCDNKLKYEKVMLIDKNFDDSYE